jgi:hypothetical protein
MLKTRRSEILLTLAAVMFASNGIASKLLFNDYISAWRFAQVRSISTFIILAAYSRMACAEIFAHDQAAKLLAFGSSWCFRYRGR